MKNKSTQTNLPHRCKIETNVCQINPDVEIIPVSTKVGEGLEIWFNWVRKQTKIQVKSKKKVIN